MPNFDGQYEVRLIYTTIPTGFPAMEHKMTFDVLPVTPPTAGADWDDIALQIRGGGDVDLVSATSALFALIAEFFPVTTSFARWELWYIPEGTTTATFISAKDIGDVGQNASPSRPAGQVTFTFRTIGGGTARLQMMESSVDGEDALSPPYLDIAGDLADYVVGLGTPIIGRDNTFVFANIHQNNGQNEKLRNKRYRG